MMTNNKDLHNNNGDKITLFANSYERRIKRAEKLLEHVEDCIYHHARPFPEHIKEAHDLLQDLYEKAPDIFAGERVYLWEMLGWAYHILGDMRKADKCLRTQAKLQPGRADAYLNLGVFYSNGGMHTRAINIYMEGLEECPGDEHLLYNLAELSHRCGMSGLTAKFENNATPPLHLIHTTNKKEEEESKLTAWELLQRELAEWEATFDISKLSGSWSDHHKRPKT